jgi:hypothetical protein
MYRIELESITATVLTFGAAIFRPILLVLLFVDFGGFVEDLLDFLVDLFSSPVLVERGVILNASAVQVSSPSWAMPAWYHRRKISTKRWRRS